MVSQTAAKMVDASVIDVGLEDQIREREWQAAINFAPPDLKRLNEKFNRPRRTYYPANYESKNDELCKGCASLDLSEIFNNGIKNDTHGGIQVRKGIPIGYSDEIYAQSTCPLCRLFVDLGDSNLAGDARDVEFWWIITIRGHEVLSTVAEPLYDIQSGVSSTETLQNEAVYLALVRTVKAPAGYRYEYRTLFRDLTFVGVFGGESPRAFATRSTAGPGEITDRIRSWLSRCSRHKNCVTKDTSNLTTFFDGFSLFDITTLKVVNTVRKEPYIALSYPRSQVGEFAIKRSKSYSLDDLPKFLQDTVQLVKDLKVSINHIWMDQLCIDPDNHDHKIANINAMGDIYEAAFATVIFAVPSHVHLKQGIPGLSAPRLPYQRVETIGSLKLATTYPSLEMAITTSQWNSRAWTFQEGLLSSRCILFGPEQIHFECSAMGYCESNNEPDLAICEQDHLIPYKSRIRNPFLENYNFNTLYWRLVRDYTGRNMTFASDSLHAFAAFSKEFERAGKNLTWGLPISSSLLHLLWEHEPWDLREITRRKEFPSWSWAGWSGTAAMNFPLDNTAISKPSCACIMTEKSSHDSHILNCRARTSKVRVIGQLSIFTIDGDSKSSIMLDRGGSINLMSSDDVAIECLMMEICKNGDFVHGLLITQKQEDVFERIGSGFMSLAKFQNSTVESQEFKLV